MTVLMLSCPEVQARLTEFQERALPFRQRVAIRIHLLICGTCRALERALRSLSSLGRRALQAPATPPPEAEQALAHALAKIQEDQAPKA